MIADHKKTGIAPGLNIGIMNFERQEDACR